MNSSALETEYSSTLERIERIVRSLLNDESIALTPETRPGDVKGWDSLANINIVFGVEEEFGVRFGDQDLAAAHTVGELAKLVERLQAG